MAAAIVACLTEKIAEIIKWGCAAYSLPILIVNAKWTFSNRYTVSHIKGDFLKFDAFFSLYDFLKMWETGGIFYESHKRVKNDPVIGTFSGNGPELLITLICHEMAHVFEQVASQECYAPGKVLSYYGKTCVTDKQHHHNALWREIYRELKTNFMQSSQKNSIIHNVDMVMIKEFDGMNFFAKHLDKGGLV